MRRHRTTCRQRRQHLIHRLAVGDGPPCDAGTNFNCRIFSFHFACFLVVDFLLYNSSFASVATLPQLCTGSRFSHSRAGPGGLLDFHSCHLPALVCQWQNAPMKIFIPLITILFATLITTFSFAQSPAQSPAVGA